MNWFYKFKINKISCKYCNNFQMKSKPKKQKSPQGIRGLWLKMDVLILFAGKRKDGRGLNEI